MKAYQNTPEVSARLDTLHSTEAEQSVLGGLMLGGDAQPVIELLQPDDFYQDMHQHLYTVIRQRLQAQQPIDVVTLSDAIPVMGLNYLGEIAEHTPSTANILTYAQIVKDRAIKRQQYRYLQTAIDQFEQGKPFADSLDQLQALQTHTTIQYKTYNLQDFISLNLPPRDFILDGLLTTNSQTVIYAKAGTGKTLFCTDLAFSVATGQPFLKWDIKQPVDILIIDGEMPKQLLQERYCNTLQRYDQTTDHFHILSYEDYEHDIDLTQDHWQHEIERQINHTQAKLVIFDNISTLFNRDDNKQVDWNNAKAWLKRLR
ncbi:MAG: DnaB-like helicase N-terminal domain-containing protein, partial [Myxococcota bacterium]